MLPPFEADTGYLPKGDHSATWAEVETALGFSAKRRALLAALLVGCREFKSAGVKVMFVDGSFATAKRDPGDFDCCYDSSFVDSSMLDPVLLEFEEKNGRTAMKEKYLGEFWPSDAPVEELYYHGNIYGFFKLKDHQHKGIIALDLATLP